MQMLKKLFSSDNKYYLELDEIKDSEVVQSAVETAEKATQAVKEKAQDVVKSEPVQEAISTGSKAVETAQDKLKEVSPDDKASSKKSAAKAESAKSEQAASNGKAAADKSEKPPTTLQNAGASSFDPPFWVAAMNNTNKKAADSNGQVAEGTFATDNLMPIVTKYRRRPGGSLSKFKDMAKTAKTPRR
ncbi:MAG: hypothetical protein AAFR89_00905 [Cyanobacteria bacterium J06633_1]